MHRSEVGGEEALHRELGRLRARVDQLETEAAANAQIIHALQGYTKRYQQLIDYLPVFFIACNKRGLICVWNRLCEQETGYSAAEIIENPEAYRWLFPDPEFRGWIEQMVVSYQGSFKDLELPISCKDGRILPVSWYCLSPQHPLPGWPFWAVGVDISLRSRITQSLRSYQRRLSTLMHHLPGMAYRCKNDADYTMLFVSRGCYELTGYLAQEIEQNAQLSYGSLIHPEDQEVVWNEIQYAIQHQSSFELVYRLHDRRGATKWVWEQGRAIGDGEGGEVVLEGFITDITEHRRLEGERLRLEQRLQQARKFESLGALAGGVAHDFNNLLMGIMGNAEMALFDFAEGSEAAKSVQGIFDSGRKAAELTRKMLSYVGQNLLVSRLMPLEAVVEGLSPRLSSLAGGQVHVLFDLARTPTVMEGDPDQIAQVLENLVLNAVEALGDREGRILVRTGVKFCSAPYLEKMYLPEKLPPGPYAYLEVTDNGPGVSREDLPKIFDPFFSTRFTGRGLGLASVLGIVRSHGGTLEVLPALPHGATFLVLFPAKKAVRALPSEPVEKAAPSRGQKTILLVDDERHIRALGKRLLERKGYGVVTAEDGIEALNCLEANLEGIDCVILDLTMPRMNGESVFKEIRRRAPRMPVLISSGYDEDAVADRFEGEGVTAFLQKPYRAARLFQVLEEIFT